MKNNYEHFVKFLTYGALFLSASPIAHADHPIEGAASSGGSVPLIHLIPTLYGGDGIQLIEATSGFSHAPHFIVDSLENLNRLAHAAEEVNIIVPSTGSGMTFELDEISGDFIASPNPQGGVFSEYPDTLAEGRFSLGFSYSYINYTNFEGQDLSGTVVDLQHLDIGGPGPDICIGGPPGACYEFERDVVRVTTEIDIKSHVFLLYGSYGLTDDLEMTLLAPIIHTSLSAYATAEVVNDASKIYFAGTLHAFDPDGVNGDAPTSAVSGKHTGLGDLYVRAKYHLAETDVFNMSALIDLRLPTGDVPNLQGVKKIGLKPTILASYNMPLSFGGIALHASIGYEVNSGNRGQNEIDYLIGAESYLLKEKNTLSLSASLIGSREVTHKDQIGDRNNDLALGFKWTRENSFSTYYGIRIALDKDGLRAATTHTFGVKLEF